MKQIFLVIVAAIVLTLGIYALSLVPTPSLSISHVENIHGIPFPEVDQHILVEETLAHADIYLKQPVFAKELELTIEFIPTNINSLAVGIRENDFWLSYPKYGLYSASTTSESDLLRPSEALSEGGSPITSQITIPITDKLQEPDQSLDLMFFAEGENPRWQLVNISVEVKYDVPSYTEFKDYARAILKRERAL